MYMYMCTCTFIFSCQQATIEPSVSGPGMHVSSLCGYKEKGFVHHKQPSFIRTPLTVSGTEEICRERGRGVKEIWQGMFKG